MAEDLEKLIKSAEDDISTRSRAVKPKQKLGKVPLPSLAAGIWIAFIVLASFQFDTIVGMVSGPAEDKIVRDLDTVLRSAAGSLERYESVNGVLPPILPNPAIRGLVVYERNNDFSYRLSATINDVTMVLESSHTMPYRLNGESQ